MTRTTFKREIEMTTNLEPAAQFAAANAGATRTVLFITGAWMHVSSWDKFRSAFEAAGYKTLAPAWPYLDADPAALRANPDKRIGTLTFKKIVDHYAKII